MSGVLGDTQWSFESVESAEVSEVLKACSIPLNFDESTYDN